MFQVYSDTAWAVCPSLWQTLIAAGAERAARRRHRNRRGRRVREAPVERHRSVAVRGHRRRRVAVVADRPGARRARQVRPVRVGYQRVRQCVVALRAAVRRAAERRVPGVQRHRLGGLPVVVAEVDPAGTERPARRRHRNRRGRRVREAPVERHRTVRVR